MEEENKYLEKIGNKIKTEAQKHHFQYDPSDWEDMVEMLDSHDRLQKLKKGFVYGMPIVLAVIFSFFFLLKPKGDFGIETRSDSLVQPELSVEEGSSSFGEISKESVNNVESTLDMQIVSSDLKQGGDDITGIAKVSKVTSSDGGSISMSFGNNDKEKIGNIDLNLDSKNLSAGRSWASLKENGLIQNSNGYALNNSQVGVNINNESLGSITQFAGDGGGVINNDNKLLEERDKLQILNVGKLALLGLNEDYAFGEPSLVNIEFDNDEHKSRILLGIHLGMSSTKTTSGTYSQIDAHAGLELGLAISNKVILRVGASYEIDKYDTPAEDYKFNQKFIDTWGSPDDINSNCSMINAHFGLSYYPKGYRNRGISFNLNGVNNFMLSETYDYLYSDQDNNWTGEWIGAHNTLLNALEFGANYQIGAMSDNSLFTFGPYATIPIRGVGHGQVKLSSYGFRLGYSFAL